MVAQGFLRSTTGNGMRAHRHLATSAQKRKWHRRQKPSKKEQHLLLSEEMSNVKKPKDDGNPFLFLVILPVVMTGLVVFLRADLREELRTKFQESRSSARNQPPESKDDQQIQIQVASKKE
jgi:hypothetical protein